MLLIVRTSHEKILIAQQGAEGEGEEDIVGSTEGIEMQRAVVERRE
jgi:hypothetical protein